MLADMEQWDDTDLEEKAASRNIFFNQMLQNEFCAFLKADLPRWNRFWIDWTPAKEALKAPDVSIPTGQTPLQIVREWIRADYRHNWLLSMLRGQEIFQRVWTHMDMIEYFVAIQRIKMRRIQALL